jgi:signal transduction histidine kinase
MDPQAKPQPERNETDESLRDERKKSDKLMTEKRAGVEEKAKALVERAREQADAVLEAARDKADRKRDTAEPDAVANERALEDESLQDQRAAADERLARERAERASIRAVLLPMEREKTDRHLLTERARSDEALARRDDFMGMVSHDLRNLLHSVFLHATVLVQEASKSDEGRRTVAGLKRIQRYVARMNGLLGDLVDVVSIDAGKLAVLPLRADAVALLTEAVDAFAPAASEKGISLEVETVERILMAEFDHERMLQVLANLITNAIKFTPPGGRIVVRGERAGNALRLSVSDTGTGIPGDMLEKVFERFWQVGKNDQRGLGLGLYISKCIVDAHGGRIWAESKLGEGTAFYFTMPGAAPRTA